MFFSKITILMVSGAPTAIDDRYREVNGERIREWGMVNDE